MMLQPVLPPVHSLACCATILKGLIDTVIRFMWTHVDTDVPLRNGTVMGPRNDCVVFVVQGNGDFDTYKSPNLENRLQAVLTHSYGALTCEVLLCDGGF